MLNKTNQAGHTNTHAQAKQPLAFQKAAVYFARCYGVADRV
jgi:hypothetical protein